MAECDVLPGCVPAGIGLLTADDPSLALVAALLLEEIQAQTDAKLAHRLQVSFTVDRDSEAEEETLCSLTSGLDVLDESDDEEDSDELISLRQQLDLINSTLSKSAIDDLAGSDRDVTADSIRACQLNLQLEARAKKERLDHEFAQALQDEDTAGGDSDVLSQQGLEATLGEIYVQDLMRECLTSSADSEDAECTSQDKGKGKLPAIAEETIEEDSSIASKETLPTCSICFEPVRPTYDPYSVSLKAGSSDNIILGMYIGPREDGHISCIDCFGAYVGNKLEDGTGKAFPMKCMESKCPYELTDEDARHGLGEANLEAWHYRKLVDSQPALFCPNRSCSARIVRDDEMDNNPQAECPSCHVMMCVECETPWHDRYTCDQYQALPPGERDPEDIALFDLARQKGYSRCPGCKMVLELVSGCYHLTCSCGVESCYLCGLPWSRQPEERVGRCSKEPPCPLADERHLLRPEYRPRDGALNAVVPQQALPIPAAIPIQAQVQQAYVPAGVYGYGNGLAERRARRYQVLNFLEYPVPGCVRNDFTRRMTWNSRCGYCELHFESLDDLRVHLAELTHNVFECCGTLYRTAENMNQHIEHHVPWEEITPHRWTVPLQRY